MTVQIDVTIGSVRSQSMVEALVAKAVAFSVPNDPMKERHLTNLAVVAAMARPSDRTAQHLTARDRHTSTPMLETVHKSRPL